MSRLPASRTVPPQTRATGARNAAVDRTAVETRPKHRSFARGLVIGLAIVVPFWLAVAAFLFWIS